MPRHTIIVILLSLVVVLQSDGQTQKNKKKPRVVIEQEMAQRDLCESTLSTALQALLSMERRRSDVSHSTSEPSTTDVAAASRKVERESLNKTPSGQLSGWKQKATECLAAALDDLKPEYRDIVILATTTVLHIEKEEWQRTQSRNSEALAETHSFELLKMDNEYNTAIRQYNGLVDDYNALLDQFRTFLTLDTNFHTLIRSELSGSVPWHTPATISLPKQRAQIYCSGQTSGANTEVRCWERMPQSSVGEIREPEVKVEIRGK
jgi:hypothetical protein